MAYQFINTIQTIIQFTILDYITDLPYDIVDLRSIQGIQFYKKIYGKNPDERKVSNNKIEHQHKIDEHGISILQYVLSHTDERSRRLFSG